MAVLQIFVFGKLRLQRGRQTIEAFATKRAEELFGYLVTNRFTLVPRERVIEDLWPENELRNGRASLSTALWRLRASFAALDLPSEAYIQSRRDTLAFQPSEPFELDLARFEETLAAADAEPEAAGRERRWRDAIGWSREPFCQGIYGEWCLIERERLERAHLHALGRLMASLIERGAFRDAVDVGHDILLRDPLREEVHRALMFCYWKVSDRALGVRQFLVCARLLQQELEVLPMPETIALYQRLVEERFDEAQAFEPQRRPAENLRSAYDRFAAAADNLNLLLDELDIHRRTTISY